jgi:8-oxo-dGTP pyrophosphatase MutT (NUDIX family)
MPHQNQEQPMIPFQMSDIPPTPDGQASRGWQLEVNGQPIDEVTSAHLVEQDAGLEATYGKRPEGFDGVVFREPGGAATVPYLIDDKGNIFVGIVKEKRPTMGEDITHNIPRRFSNFGDPDKTHTAVRGLAEKTGYSTFGSRTFKLASGLNPNSTWLDFSHSKDEGVDFYALQVTADELDLNHDNEGREFYSFPATARKKAEGDESAELILDSQFIPISEALQSRDMYTSAAAGQLAARLLSQGEYLLPQSPVEQKNLDEPTTPFEMGAVSAQAERAWNVVVNGQRVENVSNASFKHPNMGIEINYGQRPEGYPGIVVREPGGAATMPYMIDPEGKIYVGVVEEPRRTMGEPKTQNIPRGFSDFGENDKQSTALRELAEETGYQALGSRIIKLAEGLNPNSTYFDYSHSRREGVSLFAVPVGSEELELDHDDSGSVYYTFPAHVREQAEGDKPAERILGSRFIPITEALQSRDMFTSAAAGQLVARLLGQGEYLLPQVPAHPHDKPTATHTSGLAS